MVDSIELPSGIAFPAGQFTYVIEAVLADEDQTVTPRSNEATITAENIRPVATAQSVTVWEDWLSIRSRWPVPMWIRRAWRPSRH